MIFPGEPTESPVLSYQPVLAPPHSGLGIASCVLALLGGLVFLGGLVGAMSVPIIPAHPFWTRVVALTIWSALLLHLVALGLGIACLRQRHRRQLWGIVGLWISGGEIFLFVMLALVVLG